ncbi:hypothetical protein COU74_03065 [Candidatus Peregrinibacteria bacterium CG10_big_fil_rev_8_21_14_0_10_36_19]|nr:MAG: hypothetical protein COU74_03065 [Candidatus Peregrinibacteria bacterium CG10_big_fil_rev_8_21_14_0_10_36_19]
MNKIPDANLKMDKAVERKYVSISEVGESGKDRITNTDAQTIYCYRSVNGEWIPELRGRLNNDIVGLNHRIRDFVKNAATGDQMLLRGSNSFGNMDALRFISPGIATEYPDSSTASKVFATIGSRTDENDFGLVPRTNFENHGLITDNDKILRLNMASRAVQPLTPGMMTGAEIGKTPAKYVGKTVPGMSSPITESDLNNTPLAFEAHTTDTTTIMQFVDGKWVYEVLPDGLYAESPMVASDSYAGGFITGIPVYKGKDGIYAFRLNDHLVRASRDGGHVGIKHLDEEALAIGLSAQVKADQRWIPNTGNVAGNRYYVRMVGKNTVIGPPLAGDSKEVRIMGMPVGPYKDKEMLTVVWMDKPRPVAAQTAFHKLSSNYNDAVSDLTPYAKTGRYDEMIYSDSGRVQEGLAANVVFVKYGAGENGSDLLLVPSYAHKDILPSVTAMAVMDLCKNHGIEVRECDVTLEDLATADEILMTGTAMNVRGIGEVKKTGVVVDGVLQSEGETIVSKNSSVMGRVGTMLKEDLAKIMSRTHEDATLNDWMVKIG